MRELLTRGVGVLGVMISASLLLVAPVMAVEGDAVADAVLGQPDMVTSAAAPLCDCRCGP